MFWWSGVVVSALASINEVNLRRAWLVLRWLIFGMSMIIVFNCDTTFCIKVGCK